MKACDLCDFNYVEVLEAGEAVTAFASFVATK